jgi:hypothetical protein
MKGSTTRYRIRERYWTVDEIAQEACMTRAGVWSRIRAGLTGEALLKPIPDKGTILPERKIRAKLARMVKNKYKRTCPNCGHCFDMFQPAHMLRTIKPG